MAIQNQKTNNNSIDRSREADKSVMGIAKDRVTGTAKEAGESVANAINSVAVDVKTKFNERLNEDNPTVEKACADDEKKADDESGGSTFLGKVNDGVKGIIYGSAEKSQSTGGTEEANSEQEAGIKSTLEEANDNLTISAANMGHGIAEKLGLLATDVKNKFNERLSEDSPGAGENDCGDTDKNTNGNDEGDFFGKIVGGTNGMVHGVSEKIYHKAKNQENSTKSDPQ